MLVRSYFKVNFNTKVLFQTSVFLNNNIWVSLNRNGLGWPFSEKFCKNFQIFLSTFLGIFWQFYLKWIGLALLLSVTDAGCGSISEKFWAKTFRLKTLSKIERWCCVPNSDQESNYQDGFNLDDDDNDDGYDDERSQQTPHCKVDQDDDGDVDDVCDCGDDKLSLFRQLKFEHFWSGSRWWVDVDDNCSGDNVTKGKF